MNKLIVTAAVVAGLVMGSSAFAAPAASTSSATPAAKPAMAATPAKPATPAAAAKPVDPKTAACEKEWKAQKKHKQSEKAYVKACLAKDAK